MGNSKYSISLYIYIWLCFSKYTNIKDSPYPTSSYVLPGLDKAPNYGLQQQSKKSGSMHVKWRLNKTNTMENVCRYINYSILQHRTLTYIYNRILHTQITLQLLFNCTLVTNYTSQIITKSKTHHFQDQHQNSHPVPTSIYHYTATKLSGV